MPKFNQPENLEFSRPAKWPAWKDPFDLFRIATKLDKEEQILQISSIVYDMGHEAHTIYKSFTFGDVAGENPGRYYDIVMEKCYHYFRKIQKTEQSSIRGASSQAYQLNNTTLHDIARGCNF